MRNRAVNLTLAVIFTCGHSLFAGDYRCPLADKPQIRQGDAIAKSGGRFDSDRGNGKKHAALDLNSIVGAKVYAVRDGVVGLAQKAWGEMGNTVIIDHGDGEYSIYGHLDTIDVSEGAKVKAGASIGTVGYSGNAAALKGAGLPAHLHFALIRAGQTGLTAVNKPLRKMKDWGDYWQSLGADLNGPINPGLFMGSADCWSGSTTVGAPGEH